MSYRRIVEYTIIKEYFNTYTAKEGSIYDFVSKEVNKMIKNGWEPLGGPAINSGITVIQTMVKYQDKTV